MRIMALRAAEHPEMRAEGLDEWGKTDERNMEEEA